MLIAKAFGPFFLCLAFFSVELPAMPFGDSDCLRSVRGTLYDNIAEDLLDRAMPLATRLVGAYHREAFTGTAALLFLQLNGLNNDQVNAVALKALGGQFRLALKTLFDPEIFPSPDLRNLDVLEALAPAENFVNRPPQLPVDIENEPRLGLSRKTFEQKWGLEAFKAEALPLMMAIEASERAQGLGNFFITYQQLALHVRQRTFAHGFLLRTIQNGDFSSMVEAAELARNDWLLFNLARLAIVDFLSNPLGRDATYLGAVFSGLSLIKDQSLLELGREMLYDFAWHVSRPQFLTKVDNRIAALNRRSPQGLQPSVEFKPVFVNLALAALVHTGEKVGHIVYADNLPRPERSITDPQAIALASEIVDGVSDHLFFNTSVRHSVIWVAPALTGHKNKFTRWARTLVKNSEEIALAASYFYSADNFLEARTHLLELLENEPHEQFRRSVFDKNMFNSRRVLEIMAQYRDLKGLIVLYNVTGQRLTEMTAQVSQLLTSRNVADEELDPLKRQTMILHWRRLQAAILKVAENPEGATYVAEFYGWYFKPRSTHPLHNHDFIIRNQIHVVDHLLMDATTRDRLRSQGMQLLQEHKFEEAGNRFQIVRYRPGLIKLGDMLAKENDPRMMSLGLQYYIRASQIPRSSP